MKLVDNRMVALERQHEVLAKKVARLERRSFLTPEERQLVSELKKHKLRTKDRLYGLRSA